jgi:anti-sigma factor RsiW
MAMNKETKREETTAKREEVEKLLPFYVTGRLDHADAEEIGDYVERHPDVAKQLDLARAERDSAVAANAIYANRPVRSFDRVAAMIGKSAAQPARAAPRGLDWIDGIKRLFAMPSSPALRFVGAAAAIVIILQAATIATLVVERYSGIFIKAGVGNGTVDAGTTAVVRFADDATTAAITDALSSLGVRIVDGPRGGRLFTVRLGPKDMGEGERERLIAALKARNDVVVFVTQMP